MKNHLLCFNINNIEIDCILGTNGYVWIYKNDPSILEAQKAGKNVVRQ